MEVIDIVNRLIGEIKPVGESNEDKRRHENILKMIELMKELHMQMDTVAHRNKNRVEHSMKVIGEEADKYLDWLGIEDE